jgi:fatty-acyl-CoA synthase
MQGLMMDRPLLISSIMAHAATHHGARELVTRTVEGPIHRYTYQDAYGRMQQLANAFSALGVQPGDRIATLAWNSYRHFELYYAISGVGAVCHTINPRLFPEQIAYIVKHAADRFIFTDLTFLPLLEALAPHLGGVEAVVVMTDAAHMPETALERVLCYETLLAEQPDSYDWPEFDENTAAALCYTSGWVRTRDSYLIVVPMFHVCAWGLPYSCPMVGSKMVFPGPGYDGKSLHELIEAEGVTASAGVPTIWLGLLQYLGEAGQRLDGMQRVLCGGSAPPPALIRAFEEDHGVEFCHGWGMTETSPVGSIGILRPEMESLSQDAKYAIKAKQGCMPYGFEMKIVGEDGKPLPHDGKSAGELLVRSAYVIKSYFKDEEASQSAFDAAGWFRTGDVSTIDPQGYMQITDRTKDLIKSGGEWISSIDLENAVMGHPEVAEAAAIGITHPKWSERPLLVIVPAEGAKLDKDGVHAFLADKVAKWWLPDDVAFVEELPHTATGKVSKARLRERFKDYRFPGVDN